MHHLLHRLSGILQETQDSMKVFNGLQPKTTILPSFIEEADALCASTRVLQNHISIVVQKVELSSLPFLLESMSLLFDL
jgi:hypothetical protein